MLIGLEREHWRTNKKIYAGVRTFSITCLTGMLATLMQSYVQIDILLITTMFFVGICLLTVYAINIVYGRSGLTTAIALFFTYMLGILVGTGIYTIPMILALAITFILIEKKPLHSFAEHISEKDISDAIKFLVVLFVLYPLVTDKLLFNILNLKSTLFIVLLVSSISFINYISLKRLGTRSGLTYSALLGGLVSGDATIVSLANISRKKAELTENVYMGSILTIISMFLTDLIVAFVADNSGKTTLLMLPPAIVMSMIAIFFVIRSEQNLHINAEQLQIGSPFALEPAFKFGIIFSIFLVIANNATDFAGVLGTYAVALGGIISSTAVAASMAALAAQGTISYQTAAETILFACIINTFTKLIIIKMTGSEKLFKRSLKPFIIIVISGILSLLLWITYKHSLLI